MNINLGVGLEMQLESPYQGAVALYQSSGRIRVTVELTKTRIVVPAALVRACALAEIFEGEEYAATIGGMFFVSNTTPTAYRPFAAFHELAEHAAPRGFDVTGLAPHLQAVVL